MAVKFETFDEPSAFGGGVIAPFWVCDTCGERIAGHGNAVFSRDADGERTGEFFTIHKGCDTPETRRLPWEDLDMFMWELFKNAGFDWEQVEQRREERREFGLNN